MNCGPIHKRRWGPACVTISTCDNQRSSRSSVPKCPSWLVSKFKLLSMTRSLISQLSNGSGGDSSAWKFDRKPRIHCAFGSTSNSIGVSSQTFSFGMPKSKAVRALQKNLQQKLLTRSMSRFKVVLNKRSVSSNDEERINRSAMQTRWGLVSQSRWIQQPRASFCKSCCNAQRLRMRFFRRVVALAAVRISP